MHAEGRAQTPPFRRLKSDLDLNLVAWASFKNHKLPLLIIIINNKVLFYAGALRFIVICRQAVRPGVERAAGRSRWDSHCLQRRGRTLPEPRDGTRRSRHRRSSTPAPGPRLQAFTSNPPSRKQQLSLLHLCREHLRPGLSPVVATSPGTFCQGRNFSSQKQGKVRHQISSVQPMPAQVCAQQFH